MGKLIGGFIHKSAKNRYLVNAAKNNIDLDHGLVLLPREETNAFQVIGSLTSVSMNEVYIQSNLLNLNNNYINNGRPQYIVFSKGILYIKPDDFIQKLHITEYMHNNEPKLIYLLENRTTDELKLSIKDYLEELN